MIRIVLAVLFASTPAFAETAGLLEIRRLLRDSGPIEDGENRLTNEAVSLDGCKLVLNLVETRRSTPAAIPLERAYLIGVVDDKRVLQQPRFEQIRRSSAAKAIEVCVASVVLRDLPAPNLCHLILVKTQEVAALLVHRLAAISSACRLGPKQPGR